MSNLEQKANLVARRIIDKGGKSRAKLDYFGSPMNHPNLRITKFIPGYREMLLTEKYKYSPDLIAVDEYGDPDLAWVILRYNGIVNALDPKRGVVPGRILRIPPLQEVKRWLQAVNVNQLPALTGSVKQTKLVKV